MKDLQFGRSLSLSSMAAIVVIAACSGREKSGATDSARTAPTSAPAAVSGPAAPQTPDPGRKIIVVEALTDDQGNNVFRPANFEAHRGDVIRFTLKSGVHNVHFLADSNPGASGLPAASDMLQLPGQTYDVKVTLPDGSYYFQCDPHAALGMKGRVRVEHE